MTNSREQSSGREDGNALVLMWETERLHYRILSKHHSSLSWSRRMPANHLLSWALTRPWSRQRQAECRAVGPATCLSLSRLGCLSLGSIVLQQASQCQADTVDCGIQISPLMTTRSNYCRHFSQRHLEGCFSGSRFLSSIKGTRH